jgi:hypothetical protein
MVMINEKIEAAFKSSWGELNKERKIEISEQVDSIRFWGERRSDSLTVPDWTVEKRKRVYLDDKPTERLVDLKIWPLEKANIAVLRSLDERIVDLFRVMKRTGVSRPSLVAPCLLFERMYSLEVIDTYDGNPKKWAGVNLVHQRMYGTARLATRYEYFDFFGPLMEKKGRDIVFHMTKSFLEPEMRRRGLFGRGGRNG